MKGIPDLGSVLLVGLGVALLVSAIVVFVRGKAATANLALVLIFGTLLSGTGTFGLTFMREFGQFLKASNLISLITKDSSAGAQETVVTSVANGEVSESMGQVLLSAVLENAGPETGAILERGASTGRSPSGAALVRSATKRFQEKERVATDLAAGLSKSQELSTATLRRYDPATRNLITPRIGATQIQKIAPPVTPPSVHAQGSVLVRGTWSCDLDSGKEENSGSGEDFWWEQVNSSVRYLVPKSGAGFRILSNSDMGSVTYATLAGVSYSSQRIPGGGANGNKIRPGTVVAYRTSENRLGVFQVEANAYDLRVRYLTYASK